MDAHVAQELLNELGSSLENLETQQTALLRFLKDKGIVTEEQLAPYLNEAGNASSVRWRAAHVRLEHIFSAAEQKEQQTANSGQHQKAEVQTPRNQQTDSKESEKRADSGMNPAERNKVGTKEEQTENETTRPQAHESGATAQDTDSSTHRRKENAA